MLPLKDELQKRYSSYSNDRLLSIVYSKGEYTLQALELVKAELDRRNVGAHEVDVFLDELEEKRLAGKALSRIPLAPWEKALFFFIWFAPLILGGAVLANYRIDGYLLKVRQARTLAVAGFIFLILDVFVSIYSNFGTLQSLGLLILFFVTFYWFEKRVEYDFPPNI
jgi:hypothetical protein